MPGFRKWLMRWLIPDDVLALPVSRQDGFPVLLIDHMPQHAIFSAEHQAALDRWLGEVQGMPARTAIPDAATHLLVSARNGTVISVVMGVDMSAA